MGIERGEVLPVLTTIKEQKNNLTKSTFDSNWEIVISDGFTAEEKLNEINWHRHFIEAIMKNDNPNAHVTCLVDYDRRRNEYDY